MIWRCIHSDILTGGVSPWNELPTTRWGGLATTSRLIHNEISEFWPRTMVPYHKHYYSSNGNGRITSFAGGLTASSFKAFRQLSLQLPIHHGQKPKEFFRLVAAGILHLAPVLQDLRIFFLGEDFFGTRTNFQGCGLREYSDLPAEFMRRLPKEGSCSSERGVLFRTLQNLHCLYNLVVSNANYPLLHSVVGYKPRLRNLCLVTDSRSALYEHLGGPLVVWQPSATLKTMQISTNAVLGAVNMALKVTNSLQDLTFLVPASHWQDVEWKWLDEVSILVQKICCHARKMRRFRLCIEQPLREETAAPLLAAIKQYLPCSSLRVLEIHATLYSPYFGRELMEALPKTLQRLYISQELVPAKVVLEAVQERYFGRKDSRGHQQAGSLGLVGYEYWERESTKLAFLRMNGALLDRERNAHLLDDLERSSFRFGGGSFPVAKGTLRQLTIGELGDDIMSMEDIPEGSLANYEDQTVEHITEAEMAFHAEEAARAQDRVPFLVIPDNVKVGENDHWMTN